MGNKSKRHINHDALVRYARMLGFGDIHFKIDQKTGLHAIIAIHSTARGPAIGGCRYYHYSSPGQALKDAIRLSYMMTLKAAASDLPHGGAKAVIIKPSKNVQHDALFRSFGDFVHSMNGRYITAMDVGTSNYDMDLIAERTPHVIGALSISPLHGDPSPYTAQGVFRGIEAAVQFKLNRKDLDGIRIALQGGGKAGYGIAKLMHERGAKITIADPNPDTIQRFVSEFNATVVSLDDIYSVDCDIFSPCAMGGTLNHDTLHMIKAPIIAGSANNQLAHHKVGQILHQMGKLYAPDFVVNSGGLIQAASVHDYQDLDIADRLIDKLYDRMMNIYERSAKENKPTMEIAEAIALTNLSKKTHQPVE